MRKRAGNQVDPSGLLRLFLFVSLDPVAAEPDETSQFIKAASRP